MYFANKMYTIVMSYRNTFDLSDLIFAYKAGCSNLHDLSECLGITEDLLLDTLKSYKKKYGIFTTFDRYIIYFEPLCIAEIH